jgi:hypothetical protein
LLFLLLLLSLLLSLLPLSLLSLLPLSLLSLLPLPLPLLLPLPLPFSPAAKQNGCPILRSLIAKGGMHSHSPATFLPSAFLVVIPQGSAVVVALSFAVIVAFSLSSRTDLPSPNSSAESAVALPSFALLQTTPKTSFRPKRAARSGEICFSTPTLSQPRQASAFFVVIPEEIRCHCLPEQISSTIPPTPP